MELAYIYGGSNPHVANVVIGETVRAGVPLVAALTGESGAQEATATVAADALGVAQEDVTYVTAQQSDASDAERTAKVIVNPDAVWRAKMSGGAAENTLLTVFTVDNASATGVLVESDGDFSSPTKLDGVIWGLTGANKGRKRKIDALETSHASVLVPFEAIAVGDQFLAFPAWPFGNNDALQLTTNLTQFREDVAEGTGASFICVGGEFKGRGDSFVHVKLNNHLLSSAEAGA